MKDKHSLFFKFSLLNSRVQTPASLLPLPALIETEALLCSRLTLGQVLAGRLGQDGLQGGNIETLGVTAVLGALS